MPIATSEILDTRPQRDGSAWVRERHIAADGREHLVAYRCPAGEDPQTVMAARAALLNMWLVEQEIGAYLSRIEHGENVVGLTYPETTQVQRAVRFLQWAREQAREGNHERLRYAHLIIDQFTAAQIAGLIGAAKVPKIRAWADRIRAMAVEMDASAVAAEGV
jgi:hypothetical protein